MRFQPAPGATMQPAPQDNQLMSKHRVLSLKSNLRLEWGGQDGQNETEQPDHSASLGDSITASTPIRFSVHTGLCLSAAALSRRRHHNSTPLPLNVTHLESGSLRISRARGREDQHDEAKVSAWIYLEGGANRVSDLFVG